MIETLKKACKKHDIGFVVIFTIAIIICAVIGKGAIFKLIKGPTVIEDFTKIDFKELENGYVKYPLYLNFGSFVENTTETKHYGVTTNKRVSGHGYLVANSYPLNEEDAFWQYFEVSAVNDNSTDRKLANTEDHYWDFMDKYYKGTLTEDDSCYLDNPIMITGSFVKLKGKERGFYDEVIDYMGVTNDEWNSVDYYVLRSDYAGGVSKFNIFFTTALILVFAVILIYHLIRLVSNGWCKELNNFVLMNNFTYHDLDSLDRSMAYAEKPEKHIWQSDELTIWYEGGKAHIVDNSKVEWAYYKFQRGGRYKQAISHIFFYLKDSKKVYKMPVSTNAAGEALAFYTKMPWMIVGGETQYMNMYKRNHSEFEAMIQMQLRAREEQEAAAAAAEANREEQRNYEYSYDETQSTVADNSTEYGEDAYGTADSYSSRNSYSYNSSSSDGTSSNRGYGVQLDNGAVSGSNGYTYGEGNGSADGYGAGSSDGYGAGSSDGYGTGSSDGYGAGSSDGYGNGSSAGYSDGYGNENSDTYSDGYGNGGYGSDSNNGNY